MCNSNRISFGKKLLKYHEDAQIFILNKKNGKLDNKY
jgi:hypothetical protein